MTDLSQLFSPIRIGRMDVANRDIEQDERLDLNYAWYADVLLTLTQDAAPV